MSDHLPSLDVQPHLGTEDVPVDERAYKQLLVRALLDDVATFDHDDGIGVPDGGEPVRDHDRRAAAQILPLVESLPRGLDTVVGDRGYRFSGGEKQRIAIARLLLRSPSIVVLDEATAHLDGPAEKEVMAAIESVLAGRTVVTIAHRLTPVIRADRIAVMSAGAVVETGTHPELMSAGGLYRRLFDLEDAARSATEPR